MLCRDCWETWDGDGSCPSCTAPRKAPTRVPEYVEYLPLLSTYNAADLAFLKSVFEVEGIGHYFLGEFFNLVRPLVDPVRVMVRREDVGRAYTLIRDMNLQFLAISSPDSTS